MSEELLWPQPTSVLTSEGLDRFAEATNGQPFNADSKEELSTFLDVAEDGSLTYACHLILEINIWSSQKIQFRRVHTIIPASD